VKEFTIYDVKQKIEEKRQIKKDENPATSKRVYEYNPNYLSDKNIFEWNFNDEPQINTFIGKPNREMINNVNVFDNNPTDYDKYQKKIQKVEQHHKQ